MPSVENKIKTSLSHFRWHIISNNPPLKVPLKPSVHLKKKPISMNVFNTHPANSVNELSVKLLQ